MELLAFYLFLGALWGWSLGVPGVVGVTGVVGVPGVCRSLEVWGFRAWSSRSLEFSERGVFGTWGSRGLELPGSGVLGVGGVPECAE